MKMTFDEYWRANFETYYIILDNKGNFKYGKGIVPYAVIKETEKEMKKHIRGRKSDLRLNVIWNKKQNKINTIYR